MSRSSSLPARAARSSSALNAETAAASWPGVAVCVVVSVVSIAAIIVVAIAVIIVIVFSAIIVFIE
jgi:hypothetical protein